MTRIRRQPSTDVRHLRRTAGVRASLRGRRARAGPRPGRDLAEEALIRLHREQVALDDVLIVDLKGAARAELDAMIGELLGTDGAVPGWCDPSATAWQNVSRFLVDRVVERFVSEPQEEATEAADPDYSTASSQ